MDDLAHHRLEQFHVSWSPVRTVPASIPGTRIAFGAFPALTAPHTMTVPVRGSMRRLSMPGKPVMTVPRP